jgi:hypothetical protein
MATTISITVNDIPNQSMFVALPVSLYLFMDQATRPPTQPKPTRLNSIGSSHQAHEVRSTAIAVLCSLEIGAAHSGQNRAFLDILAPQAAHECKALPQY